MSTKDDIRYIKNESKLWNANLKPSIERVIYRVTPVVKCLGWVDLDLGSFPGWWAANVATFCQIRMVEYPKYNST